MSFKIDEGEEGQKTELPALKLIKKIGYDYKPNFEINHERTDHRQALLYGRLRKMLKELNKDSDGVPLSDDEIEEKTGRIRLSPRQAR